MLRKPAVPRARRAAVLSVTKSGARATRPPYVRMVKIHELLASGKYPNCSVLAGEFEVSYKTIQRDIDFMRDQMSLPIDYDSARHGFCYTEPVTSFPAVQITHGEVVALLVAQKAVEQYRGTAFEKPLRAAFEKMTSGMPEEGTFSLQELSRAISFRPLGPAEQEMHLFDVLSDAVLNRRPMEFDYNSLKDTKVARRRVEPYHLGCIGNQWYLIGKDLVRGQLRTFALTRLSRPKILKGTFRRPDNFSLNEMMAGSFSAFESAEVKKIRIRLDAFAARLASERTWHPTQKLRPLDGGGAELTLEVGIAPDLENWILSWGRHAMVLEPAELREQVASTARAMALQYSGA